MSPEEDVPDGSADTSNVTLFPARRPEPGLPESGGLPVRQLWPPARLAAVEALWGDGFITPGGAPETLRLAKPLGVSEQITLLLLGGGPGGAAQAISRNHGCRIIGMEADEQLRLHAARRHAASDCITVGPWDRHSPRFAPGSAQRVLSLEALRGFAPAPLLEALAVALHPGGEIVLTELVAENAPGRADREFAAWCRLDDRLTDLPRPAEIASGLQRLGFNISLQEDLSDRHITQTLDGWRQAVRAMAAGPRPAPHSAAAFVTEAELWLLRIRLMRRLGVRLMRWHAVAA